MTLSHAKYAAPLLEYFRSVAAGQMPVFSLLDVGASGGIDIFFRQLSPDLIATGFDPLVSEVNRLNEEEKDPNIKYEACWITQGKSSPLGDKFDNLDTRTWAGVAINYFGISSAFEAHKLQSFDYVKEVFNSGDEIVTADRYISVDEWRAAAGNPPLDILKVDVDGFDYQVLNGAHNTFQSEFPLAVITEAQVQEDVFHTKAAFGDIDVYIRNLGYRLLDIDMHRYSRAALPRQFMYDIFAQTTHGAMGACDALYMPDPVLDPAIFDRINTLHGPMGFLKLLILYDMFGLDDFGAALLLEMKKRSIDLPFGDSDDVLDLLVPENPYGATNYADYIAAFQSNPAKLFPTKDNGFQLVVDESKELDWTPYFQITEGAEALGTAYLSKKGATGYVIYGPYIDLEPGSYSANISLECFLDQSVSSGSSTSTLKRLTESLMRQGLSGGDRLGKLELLFDEILILEHNFSCDKTEFSVPINVRDKKANIQLRFSTFKPLRILLKSVRIATAQTAKEPQEN